LLDNDLNDILVDASSFCEYVGCVDLDGSMKVPIERLVSEEEKQFAWDRSVNCTVVDEDFDVLSNRTKYEHSQTYYLWLILL
jgi:hypothetical protein